MLIATISFIARGSCIIMDVVIAGIIHKLLNFPWSPKPEFRQLKMIKVAGDYNKMAKWQIFPPNIFSPKYQVLSATVLLIGSCTRNIDYRGADYTG